MHIIHENSPLGPSTGRMVVEAPYIAGHRKAGQFIIFRIDEYGERIPLTIVDSDSDRGTITLIYQVAGKSTRQLFAMKPGDKILDIAGPLGHPTEIENYGTAVCVGGGIGVAPVYPISKALKEAGNRVITIIGARSKELLILEDDLKQVSDEIMVCTDDGSYGEKGFVTQLLQRVIDREKVNFCVAVGPIPMMNAVSQVTREPGIKTLVSLNSIMIDGTGMCGGCRVTVGGKIKFTCVDGPEFDAHEVDFTELSNRLNTYREEEQACTDAHECKLEGALKNDK